MPYIPPYLIPPPPTPVETKVLVGIWLFIGAVIAAVLLVGCCACSPSLPAPPVPLPGADMCQAAEDRITQLAKAGDKSCFRKDGSTYATTPGGRPFAVDCREALADGRSRRPDCISQVPDCSKLIEAYRTPEGQACPSW